MEIVSVKQLSNGWLLNGIMYVPDASGNTERELIKEWLAEGNVPEPEFTEEELDAIAKEQKISEAKAYLERTDFKMTIDYYATLTADAQAELTAKRAEARAFLKEQGL